MALPTIPSTHRWVDGGAVVRYVGNSVTGPGKDDVVFCWDLDTDAAVTDLYDQYGNHVDRLPLVDKTFRAAVPKTVAKPVFSVGVTGARFSGNDWEAVANAQSAATSAANSAALVGAPAGSAIDAYNAGGSRGAVNVIAAGAVGDGTTDDTASLQSAINTAATFGAAVYLPRGTFKVSKPAGLDYMLEVKPRMRLYGEGTIKVASTAGNYRSILAGASPSTDLSDLTVEGITFDTNNTGNPATTPGSNGALFSGSPRVTLYVGVGSRITVRGCTFKDVDAVNTIYASGPTLTDVRVQDCKFTAIGQSNNAHDYSAIYISASGMTVTGNELVGVLGGKGATTAIETHGAGQVVTGNRIRNFYCGMNITGIAANGSDGATVADNVMRDVLIGIDLWSQTAGSGLRMANVHHNTIIIDRDSWLRGPSDYPRGVMFDAGINVGIEQLHIDHNLIWFKPYAAAALAGELQGAGIALWVNSTAPVMRNVRVENNTIVGALSAGIRWQATGERVRIGGNDIVDPGSSADSGMASFYKSGITIGGTVTDMKVSGNRTYDTRGAHVIAQGVMTSVTAVTRSRQSDNEVVCYDGTVVPAFVQTVGKPFTTGADAPQGSRFTSTLYYSPEGNRSTVATVNGTATAAPFWVSSQTKFDRIGAQVTVAGAAATVVRLGIYADNGAGTPGSLVVDAGTIAGDAVASAEVTISQTLQPGLYWLVAVAQGGAPTMTCLSGTNVIGGAGTTLAIATGTAPRPGYTMTAVSGALPSTFTSAGQSAGPILVALRAA